MYPSDSISSFRMPGTHAILLGKGDLIVEEGAKMPQDVIDALNDDDLELAMFLLDCHRGEDTELSTPSRRSMSKIIKKFFSRFRFPGFKRADAKSASRRAQKSTAFVPKIAIIYVAKMMGKVINGPVKIVTTAFVAVTNIAHFVQKQFVKPVVSVVIRPIVKIAEKITERFRAAEQFVSKKLEKVLEKAKELQKQVGQKLQKLASEVRELARPVRVWLDNKLERLMKTQKWVNTTAGQKIAKIAQQSTQGIAYALVPVTFTVQQITKRYKLIVKKIGDGSKKSFSKAKKWFDKKIAKGVMALERAIHAIMGAVERVSSEWGRRILRFFTRVFYVLLKLLKKTLWLLLAGLRSIYKLILHAQKAMRR